MHLALLVLLSLPPLDDPVVTYATGVVAALEDLKEDVDHSVWQAKLLTAWWWSGDSFFLEAYLYERKQQEGVRKLRVLEAETRKLEAERRALEDEADILKRQAERLKRQAEEEERRGKP